MSNIITVKVKNDQQGDLIIDALADAKENGDIDFPYGLERQSIEDEDMSGVTLQQIEPQRKVAEFFKDDGRLDLNLFDMNSWLLLLVDAGHLDMLDGVHVLHRGELNDNDEGFLIFNDRRGISYVYKVQVQT